MLDLNKLSESLRKSLASETTESIDNWFKEIDLENETQRQNEFNRMKLHLSKKPFYLPHE